jgi:hypothetical protein
LDGKEMKKDLKYLLAITVLVMFIGMTNIGKASSTPTISVDPSIVKDLEPGDSFAVNITIAGIAIDETVGSRSYGLYGWNINLTFDPAVLNVASVTEGAFLKETNETIFLPVTKNNDTGFVFAGAIFMPPFPERGATGSGVLATITFNVRGQGITDLNFQTSKINTFISKTTVALEHTTNIGHFANAAPSFLPIELIIIIVAVVVIGGGATLFLYKRRRAVDETPSDS